MADRGDVVDSNSNDLTTLFNRGRHFGSPCWLSTQKLTAVSTVARVNFRFVLVWRLRNQKEALALMEELSAIYPLKVLHQMYEAAIEEPHSFWYINLVSKDKRSMFDRCFEDKIVVD